MWPMDRLPRVRRSVARPRRSLAAALVLVALATLGAPVAFAGPPPSGTVGPLLQLTPTSGRASAGFTANYWYVDGTGAKCIFTTADISWDGTKVVSPKMDPPPRNSAYCSLTYAFAAPPTTAVGKHTVSILACYIDGNGKRQCPAASLARVTYTVQPTPTLKVSPGSGVAKAGFTATYSTGETACSFTTAQFFWDGKAIGGKLPIDPKTCLSILKVPSAPTPNGSGSHRLSAEACAGARCLPATQAIRSFTVTVPKPTATPKATATPTPSPTPVARPSRSVPPSVEPSTLPSRGTSAEPTQASRPTAAPTAKPTATPEPSEAIVTGTTPTTPPAGGSGPYVPAMAAYIDGPDPGGIDPAVVATNLLLTLLLAVPLRADRRDLQQHDGHAPRRGPRLVAEARRRAVRRPQHADGAGRVAHAPRRVGSVRQHRARACSCSSCSGSSTAP